MDGKLILGIAYGSLGGLGAGIVVSTAFLVATTSTISTSMIFTNPLTLVLTAIGFGLGLGQGLISSTAAKL